MQTWDETDRLIAGALQHNGRAPWGAIARALELPERTVTRRGQRLLASGLVKVSTYVDASRSPDSHPVIVRLRAHPLQAVNVGVALAARDDVSSVSVVEGPDHIVALLLPEGKDNLHRLLLQDLPAIEGVEAVNTTTVLKFFRSGWDWRADVIPAGLRPQLEAELLPSRRDNGDGWAAVSPSDEALVALLAKDGRAPVTVLANDLGQPAHVVRRRIDTLLAAGALHVRTEVEPALFGLNVEAMVWLTAPSSRIEQVGRSLAAQSSIRFCAAVTGTSQVMVNILVPDEAALYAFLSNDLGDDGSATVAETSVVVAPVRRGPMMIPDLEDFET